MDLRAWRVECVRRVAYAKRAGHGASSVEFQARGGKFAAQSVARLAWSTWGVQ